jgi:hypothetical protein
VAVLEAFATGGGGAAPAPPAEPEPPRDRAFWKR